MTANVIVPIDSDSILNDQVHDDPNGELTLLKEASTSSFLINYENAEDDSKITESLKRPFENITGSHQMDPIKTIQSDNNNEETQIKRIKD
jgi:hypothetical protein